MHKKFAKGKMFNVNLQRHFAKDKSPIPKVYQGYTIGWEKQTIIKPKL